MSFVIYYFNIFYQSKLTFHLSFFFLIKHALSVLSLNPFFLCGWVSKERRLPGVQLRIHLTLLTGELTLSWSLTES